MVQVVAEVHFLHPAPQATHVAPDLKKPSPQLLADKRVGLTVLVTIVAGNEVDVVFVSGLVDDLLPRSLDSLSSGVQSDMKL